jgi:hypothetical protein
MTSIDPDIVVRRVPGVVARALSDGVGLFHPDSGSCYRLNETGSLIWDLLDVERTFDELVVKVTGVVEDEPPALAAQVAAFVTELERRALVELS